MMMHQTGKEHEEQESCSTGEVKHVVKTDSVLNMRQSPACLGKDAFDASSGFVVGKKQTILTRASDLNTPLCSERWHAS